MANPPILLPRDTDDALEQRRFSRAAEDYAFARLARRPEDGALLVLQYCWTERLNRHIYEREGGAQWRRA